MKKMKGDTLDNMKREKHCGLKLINDKRYERGLRVLH